MIDGGAPRLLAPGGGEDIGGRLWIKCDLEPLAFTDTVGSSSTNPHVHETHVDGFWVLEPGFTVGVARPPGHRRAQKRKARFGPRHR